MHGINPLLVQVLNKTSGQDIPADPDIGMLPGKYVGLVAKRQNRIPNSYPENIHLLLCKGCGKGDRYDVGMIVFNPSHGAAADITSDAFAQAISMTNYFRCRHCNAASDWEIPEAFKKNIDKKLLASEGMGTVDPSFHVGPMQMYNGMSPNFVTEAEDQILQDFLQKGEDAFVWDRLGNIYHKGGRPELAAAAFERALQLDGRQMESHQTLGHILENVGESEAAAVHFHKALLSAGSYDSVDPYKQRELLASALHTLFTLSVESDGAISFLPEKEEIERYGFSDIMGNEVKEIELDIDPDDFESLFPLAEMYMIKRRFKIPAKDRTLDKTIKSASKYKQLEKKRKRKAKAKRKRSRKG